MNYPIQLLEIEEGLSLYIPEPAQLKSSYEELLATDPTTPFPFWAKLWASSYAMTEYLKSNPAFTKDKIVIEMGAGIGLPSFSIAKDAKKVIVSDHNKDAVALMKQNIELLGFQNMRAEEIDWNKVIEVPTADTLLLSDINYAPEQFAALLQLIEKYIAKGTQIIITTPQRMMGGAFLSKLEPLIQQNHTMEVEDPGTGVPVPIRLLIL